MSPEISLNFFLPAVIFAIGACVGSFLNVAIFQVPLGMSLKESKGSFCPDCHNKIPGRFNIPILSWLLLRGKCKWCKSKVSSRYLLVEMLTALVFLTIWLLFPSTLGVGGVIALWVLAALMIAAAFIDFDHMILPDSITLQGLGLGLVFSSLVPGLHQETIWYNGLFSSLVGVAAGFWLMWTIAMLGKLFFGRITHDFAFPVDFRISQPDGPEGPIMIHLGPGIQYQWHDVFYRRWDKIKLDVTELRLNDEPQVVKKKFQIARNGFVIDGVKTGLDSIRSVSGKCIRATVPREAVGFGNVKFVAMIGAFVGWQAVLVTTITAFGIVVIMRRFLKGNKIPFSPFLALGALTFLLFKLI